MTAGRRWARPTAPARGARAPRPEGSWSAAVARAREWWDELTGHAAGEPYSEVAAAAITELALGLWSDTAAHLDGERPADG
jgi:hypothetical protein